MAFAGTGKIWMNGKLVDWADATIHVASHVIHYGSGVFEGARCYDTTKGPAILRLDGHIKRLLASAKIYRMDAPFTAPELEAAVLDTVRVNKFRACYIRPLMYRGYNALGVNPLSCPVDVAIMAWEWGTYLGADALEKGVDVCVSSWNRMAPNVPSLAKTSGSTRAQLIRMGRSTAEGIALDTFGYVSEGSGENIFIVATARSTRRSLAASFFRASHLTWCAAGAGPGIPRQPGEHPRRCSISPTSCSSWASGGNHADRSVDRSPWGAAPRSYHRGNSTPLPPGSSTEMADTHHWLTVDQAGSSPGRSAQARKAR